MPLNAKVMLNNEKEDIVVAYDKTTIIVAKRLNNVRHAVVAIAMTVVVVFVVIAAMMVVELPKPTALRAANRKLYEVCGFRLSTIYGDSGDQVRFRAVDQSGLSASLYCTAKAVMGNPSSAGGPLISKVIVVAVNCLGIAAAINSANQWWDSDLPSLHILPRKLRRVLDIDFLEHLSNLRRHLSPNMFKSANQKYNKREKSLQTMYRLIRACESHGLHGLTMFTVSLLPGAYASTNCKMPDYTRAKQDAPPRQQDHPYQLADGTTYAVTPPSNVMCRLSKIVSLISVKNCNS
ncbi:hypothetical protein GQX74_008822 [Glossina fuscipes]|nr:hypothetical protein GQX74_008822 [Glossina fuscipes]